MEIIFDNATCGYNNIPVFENLSFNISTNEAICILGKNGVGKTTIFKTLLKEIPIIYGDIKINGTSIKDYNLKDLSKRISYIPQAKSYSYSFRVIDMVLMGCANSFNYFSAPSDKDYNQAMEILKSLDMESLATKNYSNLSGGEQQMVLAGRAVMQNSNFIIMDEPASNLDFSNQKKLIDLIKNQKANGAGVLMISHMPNHAFACCEKSLLLCKNGKYMFGNTNDIITAENLSNAFDVEMNIYSNSNNDVASKTCGIVF